MAVEKRIDMRYGVFIRPLECNDANCVSSEVTINDISTSGIGITTVGRLVKDQKVQLELMIPGDNVPLFLNGEVVWVKRGNDGKAIIHAGIRMLKLSKCDRQRIVAYIKENFYQ